MKTKTTTFYFSAKHLLKGILLIFILLVSGNSYCQEFKSVEISKETTSYNLKKVAFLLKDSLGTMSAKAAWEAPNYEAFRLDLIDRTTTNYWLKIKFSNSDTVVIPLFISLFFLDEVEVFRYSESSGKLLKEKQRAGFLVPMNERSIKVSQTAISTIDITAKKESVYLFKVTNYSKGGKDLAKSSFQMGLMGYNAVGFEKIYLERLHFSYAILGIVFMVFLYNVGIFLWTKEASFGYLALHNFIFFSWIFATDGLLISLGITDDLATDRSVRQFISILGNITYALFSKKYLKLHEIFPLGNTLFNISIFTQTVGLIAVCFQYTTIAIILSTLFSFPTFFLSIISAIIAYRKRQEGASFFIISSITISLGNIIYAYFYANSAANYLDGHFYFQISIVLEVIIFSIGVIYKFSEYKKKAIKTEIQHALEVQKGKELQEKLDFRNRKLIGNATLIISRNEKIESLQQKIKAFREEKNVTKKMALQKLEKELKQLLTFENDWSIFKMHFEDVHPNFFTTLIHKYPNLSSRDTRLVAFLKMNLGSKDIAIILGISHRSVEQAQRRLRIKMKISNGMKLNVFFGEL